MSSTSLRNCKFFLVIKKLAWKNRNLNNNTERTVKGLFNSPSFITEAERLSQKHNHREVFIKEEKNIFNMFKERKLNNISQRRAEIETRYKQNELEKEHRTIKARELKKKNMELYFDRINAGSNQ